MVDSFAEFFEGFPARMTPERLGSWTAKVRISIAGDGGADWFVSIAGGRMAVTRDSESPADTTILVGADDFQKILAGKLNPIMASMTGKLRVRGNVPNAMKLSGLLGTSSAPAS